MTLTLVQFPPASCEVHICDAHELGKHEDFPEEIEDQEDGQADISGNKVIDVPIIRQKDLESIEKNNEIDTKNAEVAGVRLEGCLIGQLISINAVVREPLVEADVCDQDDVPSNETSDGCNIHEPPENDAPICIDVHIRKKSCEC